MLTTDIDDVIPRHAVTSKVVHPDNRLTVKFSHCPRACRHFLRNARDGQKACHCDSGPKRK